MIELDGVQYSLKTPAENAQEMVEYINNYCNEHNIKNTKGEIVNIAVNTANPLYMICYGFGYLASILQKLLYSAGCSLSISRSSNRQLMNIAEIAGVHRKKSTKTTIPVVIISTPITQGNSSPCVITKDLEVSYRYGEQVLTFSPAYEKTINPGESLSTVLICHQEGSFSIPERAITSFVENPEGFGSIISEASIPGQAEESYADLRARIQERGTVATQLDRAAAAITQLEGVTLCNIYFNYSNISSVTVGGVEVQPRQALLFVQGYSDDIAKTFYNYLSCTTADSPNAITQSYVTHSFQELEVHITPPSVITPYIMLYIGGEVLSSTVENIKKEITTLSSSITIGQPLLSTTIISKVKEAFPELLLQGVEVSLTGEPGTYSYKITPQPQQLIGFKVDNILIAGNI